MLKTVIAYKDIQVSFSLDNTAIYQTPWNDKAFAKGRCSSVIIGHYQESLLQS